MYAQMVKSEATKEDPEKLAAFQARIDAGEKIERKDKIVKQLTGGGVHHAIDHKWHCPKVTGRVSKFPRQSGIYGLPAPGNLQLRKIFRVNLVERCVLFRKVITSCVSPFTSYRLNRVIFTT